MSEKAGTHDWTTDQVPLASLVAVCGGVSAVARRLGTAHTPVGRFLRSGAPTLSQRSRWALYSLLGINPDGRPRSGLHVWDGRPTNDQLRSALTWLAPGGGEVAVSPWSAPDTVPRLVRTPAVRRQLIVVRTGDIWLVLRPPLERRWQLKDLGPLLAWRGGSMQPQLLHVSGAEPVWEPDGIPSQADCEAAWSGPTAPLLWDDAVLACRQAGLTPEIVIAYAAQFARHRR